MINYDVGLDQLTKPGEPARAESTLVRIHTADRAQADAACARLNAAFVVPARPPLLPPLISEVVRA